MRTLLVSSIATLLTVCALPAQATRQVRVYEVNVSAQTEPAVQSQSGLRQVLVRATGARDAANDPALAAAQRLGADAVMIGYGDAVADGGAWRWNLAGPGLNESWSGSLDDGVNAAADIFAHSAQAFAALPELSILVEVEGVAG